MVDKKIMKRASCFLICLLLSGIFTISVQAENSAGIPFLGDGTRESPYLITTVNELACFRDLVNGGMDFQDNYFYQTDNIDLLNISWIPIGIFGQGNYFFGTYNGGGHVIKNLCIDEVEDPENSGLNHQGLFGQLGGVVLNLGIESGSITGSCVGSIASHSAPDSTPYIINCYSRANLTGFRAGGIVDNFSGGTVINCWYDPSQGGLEGPYTGTIASYAGILIDCFGQDDTDHTEFIEQIAPRPISDMPLVTRETESQRSGIIYAYNCVQPDMLIPWEYDGRFLRFSDRPLELFSIDFQGSGTRSDPYLIQDYRDLCNFRNLVCTGNDFHDVYFRQTADIVMETDDWTPIGIYGSGNYFRGVYDGAGHTLSNLIIRKHFSYSSNGLFGQLSGVVANLGIESGYIEGNDAGSIAARLEDQTSIAGYPVAILNCYNKATLYGSAIGGIAYYARGGVIVSCWSDFDVKSNNSETNARSKGILYNSFQSRVFRCSTTADEVAPELSGGGSQSISASELYSKSFVNRLNISTAMGQVLFGNRYGVQLKEWTLDESGTLRYSPKNFVISFFQWLNEFLPVLLLASIVLVIALYLKSRQISVHNIWTQYSQQVSATAVILGVVSIFVDCAAFGSARGALNLGNISFLLLCNSAFLFCAFLIARNISIPHARDSIKKAMPLLIIMGIAFALEVPQLYDVPRYDGNIYYGGLVEGTKLFQLDFFTYWGAFVYTKQFQGSALLLAPLEFFFPGQIFGLHLSSIIITEVTLVIMYCLIRDCYEGISPLFAALGSAILLLCPYQLGLLTHLTFDNHLTYYVVWLLYAYKRKNILLTSFCGFLLCFSKVTGAELYVVFLAVAALCEVISQYQGNLIKRICNWWKWGKCLLWMLPAVLYGLYLLFLQSWINLQATVFSSPGYISGGFGSSGIHLAVISPTAQQDVVLQSFVFGFRWLFVLLILIGTVLMIERRKEYKKYVNQDGLYTIVAASAASVSLAVGFLIVSMSTRYGRYTAPLNAWYALCLPLSIRLIFSRKTLQQLCAGILTVLLLVQTYWTIDPSIPMFHGGEDSGKKTLYTLTNSVLYILNSSSRLGECPAYNMEYNYYNSLIQDTLRSLNPSSGVPCYVLDVDVYELELNGVQWQFPIVWNTRLGRLNYDWDDPDAVKLNVRDMSSKSLLTQKEQLNLPERFYLFVPARIKESSVLQRLEEDGYDTVGAYHAENIYGMMTTYEFSKDSV